MAVGGEISDEPAVMGYFNAARVIGGTWLSVAHVPKAEHGGKPIGSQYWYTQPQGGTYEMLGETEEGQNTLNLTVIHRKTNDERNPTLAWEVTFDPDAITFRKADPLSTTTDTRKLPPLVRIQDCLGREGALTVAEIKEKTGVAQAQATNVLKRAPDTFVKVGAGRPQRWGLVDQSQRELSDKTRQLSSDPGGELSTAPPKGGGASDNTPGKPYRTDIGKEERMRQRENIARPWSPS